MKIFFKKCYQSREESCDELSSENVTITVLPLDCLQYYHIFLNVLSSVAVYCQYTVFLSPAKCSQDLCSDMLAAPRSDQGLLSIPKCTLRN